MCLILTHVHPYTKVYPALPQPGVQIIDDKKEIRAKEGKEKVPDVIAIAVVSRLHCALSLLKRHLNFMHGKMVWTVL